MGSGGASLATARFLRQKMLDQHIHCRFALGGITGQITAMHEEGLIDRVLDVQSFDLDAALSLKNNHFHHQIGATYYASHMISAAVDQLDFVILSALEIDTDFNVNVLTGSDGVIRGAIGGHPDTAEGASLSVVVAPLTRGRIPTTAAYNRRMKEILPTYGVSVTEIPRLENISATAVRRLLAEGRLADIQLLVPETTYAYCQRHFGGRPPRP